MAIDLASLQTVSYRVDDPGDHGIAVVSLDRVDKRNAQVEAVTIEDAKRVAKKLIKPDDLIVTIVGKPAKVQAAGNKN